MRNMSTPRDKLCRQALGVLPGGGGLLGALASFPRKRQCEYGWYSATKTGLRIHSCVHALSPTGADFMYRSFVGPSRLKT